MSNINWLFYFFTPFILTFVEPEFTGVNLEGKGNYWCLKLNVSKKKVRTFLDNIK